MKAWTDWEILRHQVAIGGRVVDDNDKPVRGVRVTITGMPAALKRKIDQIERGAISAREAWEELDERADRTLSRADGLYYFLDLPAGKYTLEGIYKRSGLQDKKTVSVSWKRDGKVKLAIADLTLSKV